MDGLESSELDDLYESCTCHNADHHDFDFTSTTKLSADICSSDKCSTLAPFLTLFFFGQIFTFMNATPSAIILMRSIESQSTAVSLSLMDFFTKLIAAIPCKRRLCYASAKHERDRRT